MRPQNDAWFPIALMLIVLLAIWLGISGPLQMDGLLKWQPLIAAVIATCAAVAAAVVAWKNTNRSIVHQSELETKRRAQKFAAIRAVVPLALSSITDYSEKCAAELVRLHGKSPRPAASFPAVPSSDIKLLADFIEFASIDTNLIIATVVKIQIQRDRIASLIAEISSSSRRMAALDFNIETYIIDTAIIYARVAAAYEYARGRDETLPHDVSWDGVYSALRILGVMEEEFPNIYKTMSMRSAHRVSPS